MPASHASIGIGLDRRVVALLTFVRC